MKKTRFILLYLLGFHANLFAQWAQQNSGTTKDLTSIHFPTKDTGYAVGLDSTFVKTIDGGANWLASKYNCLPYQPYLPKVFFVTGSTGFIISDSSVYKTTDGGISWQATHFPNQTLPEAIHFPTKDTGYTLSFSNKLYKTINCGANWTPLPVTSLTITQFLSIYFTSADTGYMGGAGYIAKTTDGGLNWTTYTLPLPYEIYALHFPSANVGYGVGNDNNGGSALVKTTNAGLSWTVWSVGSNALSSVFFTSIDTGYVVGYNTIYKTTNGGIPPPPWFTQTSNQNPVQPLNSIFFTDATHGYICGDGGTILQLNNSNLDINSSLTSKTSVNIYPNPTSNEFVIDANTIDKINVDLYDVNGRCVLTQSISGKTNIDISNFNEGVYTLTIKTANSVVNKKLVLVR